jgi:hypothetical protein
MTFFAKAALGAAALGAAAIGTVYAVRQAMKGKTAPGQLPAAPAPIKTPPAPAAPQIVYTGPTGPSDFQRTASDVAAGINVATQAWGFVSQFPWGGSDDAPTYDYGDE